MSDVSPDAPCGEDLVYDADFIQFEKDFAGKPEIVMGDSVQEAEEPEWGSVRKQLLSLLDRTRDLRLLVPLAVVEMQVNGLDGLCDGLRLIRWALDERWDSVHPQLDPDDDNDPLERVNTLAAMSTPTGADGDDVRFRERFQRMALIRSRVMGSVSLREIRRSEDPDADPGEDGETADARRQRISAITSEIDPGELDTAAQTMGEIASLVRAIDDRLTDLVGASQAANFEGLLQDVNEANSKLSAWSGARGGGGGSDAGDGYAEPAGGAAASGAGGGAGGGGGGGGVVGVGEIRSVDDVQKAFDRIVQYYQRHEPSSPVPVIVGMAQGLLGKSFLDIASAMTPEAIETIERVMEVSRGGGGGGSEYEDDD